MTDEPVRPAASSQYRADIDGLRAIAVIAVILFHLFPARARGGFVGVDVFFVISGFLISSVILSGLQNASFTYSHFYARRIRRIFPALAAVLAGCLAIAWYVDYPAEFKIFGKHVLATAGFASNIVFWRESGYFDASAEAKPLLHLWSLGVEEQYYLLWPVILTLIYRSKRTLGWIAGLGLVSFIINVLLTSRSPSAAFYLPVTRFWELLIGSGLACHSMLGRNAPFPTVARQGLRNLLSASGLIMIFAAILGTTNDAGFPGWYALLPALGSALLIAAGPDAWLNKEILSRRIPVFIGLISYPLYLWHWPLLSFGRLLGWRSDGVRLSLVALSVILAWLTYRFVEAPLRFGSPTPLKPILLVLAIAFIGLVGLAVYRTDGSTAHLASSPLASDLADTSEGYHHPCSGEAKKIEPPLNHCRESGSSPPVAAIFGDSHADSVFHGIAQVDRGRNWLLIGNSSCPPVNGVSVKFKRDTTNLLQCQERSEAATRFLIEDKGIRTVVLSFFGGYFLDSDLAADHLVNHYGPSSVAITARETALSGKPELFFYGIEKTVTMLQGAGKQVALIVDTPELPFFPRDAIRGYRLRPELVGGIALPLSSVLSRQAELRKMVDRLRRRHPQLIVYDPLDLFCEGASCRIVIGDILMYRDSHHLSTRGSKLFAQHLLAALGLWGRL